MRLTGLRRYPVKGIGREALETVEIGTGGAMPGDRAWAVAHEACPDPTGGWRPRGDFLVVAAGPALAAVSAQSDGNTVTLRHPDRPETRFDLPGDSDALIGWVRPLWPDTRPAPTTVVRAPVTTGMPDNGIASVSILTEASLAALSEACGAPVDAGRFRGNLILDGGAAWEEFDWVDRKLHVGGAVLKIIEPIERCRATEANPATGTRDINMLSVLRDHFGHRHFGVYAKVIEGGPMRVGDDVRLSDDPPEPEAPIL